MIKQFLRFGIASRIGASGTADIVLPEGEVAGRDPISCARCHADLRPLADSCLPMFFPFDAQKIIEQLSGRATALSDAQTMRSRGDQVTVTVRSLRFFSIWKAMPSGFSLNVDSLSISPARRPHRYFSRM